MGSSVSISLMYRRAPEAIEWLCNVFGFAKHAVYPGENNAIAHSELTFGGGMVMVGSWAKGAAFSKLIRTPDQTGGVVTSSVNLMVKDADEVYARVKRAGAKIVSEIEDKPYGGRGFSCADPEGYIWHVGTYDPWSAK